MTKQFLATAALATALLASTAGISTYAAGITIGGNSGSAASTTIGGNTADVTLGSNGGPLATVDSNGNPLGNGSQTNANIDLGSLLDGLDLGGNGSGLPGSGGNGGNSGTGGAGGSGVSAVFAGLSTGDQNSLRIRCRAILGDPTIYKADVVDFCRTVVKL